jgi:hypothetical protein
MYMTPYPSGYDQIPFPLRFKVPDFTKFSGKMIHPQQSISLDSAYNVEK